MAPNNSSSDASGRTPPAEDTTRLFAVLTRVDEAILRSDTPLALYQELCRSLADDSGRPLVWVGVVEDRIVRPVAGEGPALAYLEGLRVEVDGRWGQGPIGTAVREGRPVVNDDFEVNPATWPWRDAARRHNLRASAAFPLRHQGVITGVLTLYGRTPGAFTPEQVQLLSALATNISYALEKMGQEQALRESERSLREAEARKNEFLGVLSHELRNPLTPIRNSLQVLDRAGPGSHQAQRAIDVINRQVGQLVRLVDDLLDVTRIDRGTVQLQRTHFELCDLLSQTVEDHRSMFLRAGIEVEMTFAEKLLWVDADAARIAQLVGNLLHNAVKFTNRGGRVVLALDADLTESVAVIRVRDTGVGFGPEVLPHLFQPFTHADRTLDRGRGGLGLGLALVKGLTELHGGSVEAASEGVGMGAAFTVRLPLARASRALPSAIPPGCAGAGRRVLIIEDNVDAAESLKEALELGSHHVEVAYNGPDGLSTARHFQPDVVLCDIGLPAMDGYAVARALRADEALRHNYLVALTGYTLPDDLSRCRAAGFNEHLSKPPNLERLQKLIALAAPVSRVVAREDPSTTAASEAVRTSRRAPQVRY